MLANNSSLVSYLAKRETDEEYEKALAENEEKKIFCKKLELFSHVTGLVGDLMGDIPDPTKTSTGLAMVAHLAQAGVDITATALECDDVNFDEIKLIMEKRFNDIDKKLDEQTQSLEEVSRKVSETLLKIDNIQTQMYRGFKYVIDTIQNKEIQTVINKINTFARYFEETRQLLSSYNKKEFIDELNRRNNILSTLEDFSNPGNSLYSALYELIDKNNHYANPVDVEDDKAFQALYALYYGTQTYFLVKVFLMKQYASAANFNYESGNFENYNSQLAILKSIGTKFKISIFSDVIDIVREVKNKNYLNDVKNEWYKDISEDVLLDLKRSVETVDLNIIDDNDEVVEVKDIDFATEITSQYGDWKDKSTVIYAVQLRNKNKYSAFSSWSKSEVIGNKANPSITVPQDNKGRERLIFRKFDKSSTQFVGVMKGSETQFRDINRDLYNAAGRGDQELACNEMKLLIDNGADINVAFEHGRNLMHAAAAKGNEKVVADFLFGKLDVNSKDENGYTPLHIAAESNQKIFVQELIRLNASVNAQTDDSNLTPLHIAAKNGYLETVTELMKSPEIIINAADKGGFTALHHATHKKGNSKIIKALLKNNDIEVSSKTKLGLTPLHLAALNGYSKVIEALLNSSKLEDINETDDDGMTALHFAAMSGKFFTVKRLLQENNIGINHATIKNKWTPLHFAIYFRNSNIASELLNDARIDINLVGSNGITPLHLAVATGQLQTAENLLNKGADRNATVEDDGSTAVHLAMKRTKLDALLLMIQNNFNLNAQSVDGSTPLHLAAKYRKLDFLNTLLEADVNGKIIDNNGLLAIQIAINNMDINFVRAIVEKYPSIVDPLTKEGSFLLEYAHEKNFRIMYHYLQKKDSSQYAKYYGSETFEVFKKLGVNDLFNVVFNPNDDPEENNDNYDRLVRQIYNDVIIPCINKELEGTPCPYSASLNARLTRGTKLKSDHRPVLSFYPSLNLQLLKPVQNSIPTADGLSTSKNYFSNSSNHLHQEVNTNSAILLLDLLIRRLRNEKYNFLSRSESSSLEYRAKALNITDEFERLTDSLTPIRSRERINLAEVSSSIYKALKSDNGGEIANILSSYVKEVLKPTETTDTISEVPPNISSFRKKLQGNIFNLQNIF